MLYPLKFKPIYKEKIWGGQNLKRILDKQVLEELALGESWELSAHGSSNSIVCEGSLMGRTLTELSQSFGQALLGENYKEYQKRFPLLIKFIDANHQLSVQVHPKDEYSLIHENDLGKTEMWYIIDAKPGSKLVYGLKENITKEMFRTAIKNNEIRNTLNEIEVRSADVLYIPAGTVHAIGKGIVLAEIQQNSDTTYRVYDWDRVGLDGRPRELHIQKALDVIEFSSGKKVPKIKGIEIEGQGYTSTTYVTCPYFTMDVLNISTNYETCLDGRNFEVLMAIDGQFNIEYNFSQKVEVKRGETVLIPASIGRYKVEGRGKLIKTYIGNPEEIIGTLIDNEYSIEYIREAAVAVDNIVDNNE